MKALKNMGFGPRKSKSGFTLIELLIVMVILAILAGVVVMAVGGVFGTAKSAAYDAVKDDISNAVTGYATDNEGNFPYNVSTPMTANANCSTCYVINMSALLVSQGGMLRNIPDGTRQANCAAGGASGCSDNNHYTWGVNTYGVVYSRCDTADSKTCTSNESGYQGVWP